LTKNGFLLHRSAHTLAAAATVVVKTRSTTSAMREFLAQLILSPLVMRRSSDVVSEGYHKL
jgi:hypothetical protein